MPQIINHSEYAYGEQLPSSDAQPDASIDAELVLNGTLEAIAADAYVNASIDFNLELLGELAGAVFDPFVNADLAFNLNLQSDFISEAVTPGDSSLAMNLSLQGSLEAETGLFLQNPPPIVRSVAADAFTNQRFKPAKLFINDSPVPFLSAEISVAPGGTISKTVAVDLGRADLAQIPDNAIFRLEIYQFIDNVWKTHVVLDGGKLTNRSYRMSSGRDGLNISIKSGNSKLDKFPKNNLIVFDPGKAEVSTDEIEPLYTNTNETITTTALNVPVLTLKKLLDIAFVEGCGFSSIETDIPNYEVTRCDFSVVNSYASAVADLMEMYEPEFSVDENDKLTIQKTVQPLPDDYQPNAIVASRYPNFTEAVEYALFNLDGYVVYYTATKDLIFRDRSLPAKPSTVGNVETNTKHKIREWFDSDDSIDPIHMELKQEIVETRRNGFLSGRETTNYNFDYLARNTGYTKIVETRLPDIDIPVGSGSVKTGMLKTREETQKIHYQTNPHAPRTSVFSKIETIIKSLLALDTENTGINHEGKDDSYAQDYQTVYENGDLKPSMTKLFRELRNTVEYFTPQRDGTVAVRYEGYDLLHDAPQPAVTDVRSGDISVKDFQNQGKRTIFKTGVTQATRNGELKVLNFGALPGFFAIPLAAWLLANPPVIGKVEVVGFDESLDRGVAFTLKGRNDETIGRFKTRGYQVLIKPDSIMTIIDALKV